MYLLCDVTVFMQVSQRYFANYSGIGLYSIISALYFALKVLTVIISCAGLSAFIYVLAIGA